MTGLSISNRLVLASIAILLGFLGLTGMVPSQAFERSARAAVLERLQSHIYMLLGVAETDDQDRLHLLDQLPEPRLSTSESGLYAQVSASDHVIWQSRSLSGLPIPQLTVTAPGAPIAHRQRLPGRPALNILAFAVDWENAAGESRRYLFQVAESESGLEAEIGAFRRSLWLWLGAVAIVLVAAQTLILRWSIAPLRDVAREVRKVELGELKQLSSDYPCELRRLTENLNQFITLSQDRLHRYRNALGNLAHSLKTPMAVIRSELETAHARDTDRVVFTEQLGRLEQTVDYQLRRASAVGRSPLALPVAVLPVMRRLVEALRKIHKTRELEFEVSDADCVFAGDEGDMTEMLGNLADNACKWAGRKVRMTARCDSVSGTLILAVEDDGPGIDAQNVSRVLQRGARLNRDMDGQGLVLAVVRELVEDLYSGRLQILRSELGGARIEITSPGQVSRP